MNPSTQNAVQRKTTPIRALDLLNLFERLDLWTIGVFRFASTEGLFEASDYFLVKQISETGLRVNRHYQAVAADPFLISSW
jgi:hypothetical protein